MLDFLERSLKAFFKYLAYFTKKRRPVYRTPGRHISQKKYSQNMLDFLDLPPLNGVKPGPFISWLAFFK